MVIPAQNGQTDNGERLEFAQKDGVFSFKPTGYPYGMNTCVRVAKARIKRKNEV